MILIYIITLAVGVMTGAALTALRCSRRISSLTAEREVEAEKARNLQKSLDEEKERCENRLRETEDRYSTSLSEQEKRSREQLAEQMKLLREQVNTSAEEILRRRQEQLAEANRQQLSAILNPLNNSITLMRQSVESSKLEQSKTIASLETAIHSGLEQAKAVGESADRLASALTGENKIQGNFGELKLKELLDSMGFTEGEEYDTQLTLRDERGRAIKDDETGSRLIPDVVLHFPDRRDLVIDSKMSLRAFEEYQGAEDSKTKDDALRRHVASLRSHVTELKNKDYSRYLNKGASHPDFVIMYVFSEGALQLALSTDPTLWRDAYDAGVLITGSQNMYALLRILEMSWKQMRQVENQENIIKTASEVVKRVQILYERFVKADEALKRTVKAFSEVETLAAPSGRSISTAARQLVSFGASADQRHAPLPQGEDNGKLPGSGEKSGE